MCTTRQQALANISVLFIGMKSLDPSSQDSYKDSEEMALKEPTKKSMYSSQASIGRPLCFFSHELHEKIFCLLHLFALIFIDAAD